MISLNTEWKCDESEKSNFENRFSLNPLQKVNAAMGYYNKCGENQGNRFEISIYFVVLSI